MALDERLRGVAAQNSRLLQTLSDTDYAVSAFQQSSSYVATLKKQIAESEKKTKELARTVANEYEDFKEYRDVKFKKLAMLLNGKKNFQERESKEEREWLDAVQNENRAKKELEHLKLNLVEAEKMNAEMQNLAGINGAAQAELNELYKNLFDGPTPAAPEEDEKENAVKQAENNFNVVQMRLNAENHTKAILLDADKFLKRAIDDIEHAMSASMADLWGVGGKAAEMAENSALSRAQSHCSQVEMLMGQANRLQPAINHIGEIEIAQQHFLGDVLFDNIFSDLSMRDKIKTSRAQLHAAQRGLTAELNKSEERVKKARAETQLAKMVLDEKRGELQRVRAAVFDRLSGGEGMSSERRDQPLPDLAPTFQDAPPSYTA